MADIPAKLRQADITRFLNRGNQLRQFKPAITYWCEYWAVRQILMKQLHNVDDECLAFTTNLMDELEKTKTDHPDDEAITDEAVGQALVEQFAQQTFDRAERTMTANKVTRQTADTFDAASTFFQLLNAWGPLDAELQKKVKYAKWNAARILRAIKEGEDPNDSNPKHEEPSPDEALPELDPSDPDVQLLSGTPSARPATVEDDPDAEFYTRQAAETPAHDSPALPDTPLPAPVYRPPPDSPSDGGLAQPSVDSFLPSVSDLGPPAAETQSYFPPTQQFPPSPSSINPPELGSTPAEPPSMPTFLPDRTAASPATSPWQGHQAPQPPQAPHPNAVMSPPVQPRYQAPPPQTFIEDPPTAQDEGDIPGATKHARFAISALNFEDVPTAIKELRAALASLGAR